MKHIIDYYRKTLNVQRMQGTFKHRNYNLAEHQYGVAMLFRHFAMMEGIDFSIEVYDAVLHHDLLEVVTTDLLWQIKNLNETTKRAWNEIETEVANKHFMMKPYLDIEFRKIFNEEQHKLFKVCDALELWLFCKEEIKLGNKHRDIIEAVENTEEMMFGKFSTVDDFIREQISNERTSMVR